MFVFLWFAVLCNLADLHDGAHRTTQQDGPSVKDVVVGLPSLARRALSSGPGRTYLAVAVAMPVLGVLSFFLFGTHRVFAVELVEILCFVVFWIAQTLGARDALLPARPVG